jgi:hypothetical protein
VTRQNFVESLDIFDFVWIPTLNGIALLFGLGIAFASVVSLCAYLHLRKKQEFT